MALNIEADLDAFFQTGEFAVTANYTLADTSTGTLDGIFDTESEPVNLGEAGFIQVQPTFHVQTSKLPAGMTEGATLQIKGATYRLAFDPIPNGTGVSVLTLEGAG
ncbi:head-tail joining protein [Roseibium litorale]|uniref:Head-tail joining protein n=1 Tax=Roseibium litorale TaxID=2803841 RepID=A0ABR9CT30_9HYPH|nr:hypothetical protein [Roseibium litorale]MBD8894036.1 hypothetical protein [Roseibium litorale]